MPQVFKKNTTPKYIDKYNEDGYAIIKNVLDLEIVRELNKHVRWLRKQNPHIRPEAFHHHLLVKDPFIHFLLHQERLLNIVQNILGSNIALFGAHYIAKKPLDGKPVGWHQDGSYWPLKPMEVLSVWIACTKSEKNNACMRVIPGSQNMKIIKPSEMVKLDLNKFVLDLAIDSSKIDDTKAVDIELNPGDISIHNPLIIHGSNSNHSKNWRIGLTLRYIPTTTFVDRKNWDCILLKGHAEKSVNNKYIDRPSYKKGLHMPFKGCEE